MTITIIGNITRDAELKRTKDGKQFLSISVAETINYQTEETAWYDVTVWNEKQAEALSNIAKKRWGVTVVGDIKGIYANQRPDGNISTNFKVSAKRVKIHQSPRNQEQQSFGSNNGGSSRDTWQSSGNGTGRDTWQSNGSNNDDSGTPF